MAMQEALKFITMEKNSCIKMQYKKISRCEPTDFLLYLVVGFFEEKGVALRIVQGKTTPISIEF